MTGKSLTNKIEPVKKYTTVLGRRINRDRMTVVAGNLTYVSLLSLVPFLTVLFFFLAAFPMFSEIGEHVRSFLMNNIIPTENNVIEPYLRQFISNTNKMTAVGAFGLIITSLMLINSVDKAVNHIFRSQQKRPLMYSLAVYWMILTLGPILLGFSLVISSYLFSMHFFSNDQVNSVMENLLKFLPLIFQTVILFIIYSIVPTKKVIFKDAVAGAIVASILFEISKKLFALYVTIVPTFELIYGVLSIIPIFFMWVYYCWCVVLLGAEITASMQTYRGLRGDPVEPLPVIQWNEEDADKK